jgi:O-antigen ligase
MTNISLDSHNRSNPASPRSAVTVLNLLLAAIIIYIPYQNHYPVVIDIKGLNLINTMFLFALLMILVRKSSTESPTPLKGIFLSFFAVLTLSFLIGQLYDGSRMPEDLTALKSGIFYMLFYFLFYHGVRDVKSIRFLLGAILFVTLIVSVHAFRQALDYGLGVYNESRRAGGPFAVDSSGSNLAAAFFVIFVPLFISLALYRKSAVTVRLAALAFGIFGVFAAFFTYSRQAYFILAILLLLRMLRGHLFLGVLLTMAILNYDVWVPEGVVDRLTMTEQTDEQGEKKLDESTESRFIIWEGASQMIAERPWGIGLNHFPREMGRYVPGYNKFDAHNGYILVTTEMGVQGLIVLVILLGSLLNLSRKVEQVNTSEEAKSLGTAFQISVIAAILANLFGSRFFNGEVMGNFWILSGLVARYYTLELERQTALVPPPVNAVQGLSIQSAVVDKRQSKS